MFPIMQNTQVKGEVLQGRDIFVSNEGSDTNSGLEKDKPKKTVDAALKIAVAGDRVLLLPGVYYGPINIKKNGEPDKPITLMSASSNPNEYAIIDGQATVPEAGLGNLWLKIKDTSWFVVKNLHFRNGWEDPITISDSSYLTFEGSRFEGGRRVIYPKGPTVHHILVQNNHWDQGGDELWNMSTAPNGGDAWEEMHHGSLAYYNGSLFYPKCSGGSHVIRDNTLINGFNALRWKAEITDGVGAINCDSNIEVYNNKVSNMRDNDFEPESAAFNVHVYHNVSHNIHKTMSVDTMIGGHIYYYGNVVTADSDAWTDSIATGWWKVYNSPLTYPMVAFNNSFYGNQRPFNAMAGPVEQFKHYNNAYHFTGDRGWVLDAWGPAMEFDNDCSNKAWPQNIVSNNQEQHGILANPDYVDGPNGNLRLKPTSVCRDAGRVINLPEFGWTQKYTGNAPDIGAYEGKKLVEGPAFKFIEPPGGVTYTEKPRIVRHEIVDSEIRLFFSTDIQQNSLNANDLTVFKNGTPIKVNRISFPGTRELLIRTSGPLGTAKVNLVFTSMPTGINGEKATVWASTIEAQYVKSP